MDDELEKALVESLHMLQKIQRLEIYCKPSTRAVMWGESRLIMHSLYISHLVVGDLFFCRLPSWINPSSLPILCHLHLGLEVLEDGDLERLGSFSGLRSFVLMSAASDEQEHRITTVGASDRTLFEGLNFFSTNMAVRFERPTMPKLEHVEFRVRVAQIADSWLSSLANLPSLENVTVVLDCRGASAAEMEEAEKTLRLATGVHLNRRLKLEVTKENGNDEVLFYDKTFAFFCMIFLVLI